MYRGDHTEAIDIDFDPSAINFAKLLDIFWKNHDPTARTTKQVCSLLHVPIISTHNFLSDLTIIFSHSTLPLFFTMMKIKRN